MLKKILVPIIYKVIQKLDHYVDSIIVGLNRYSINAIIGNNVKIFKETEIKNFTADRENITIGNDSVIRGKLTLFPSGKKIAIGDNTYIGSNTIIWIMDEIEIGDDVLIAHNVNILDNNSHSTDINTRKNELSYIVSKGQPKENIFNISISKIKINNGVWIGMNSIILKGVEIGENAIVAAGSIVTKNVPPNTMVTGNPARVVKTIKED